MQKWNRKNQGPLTVSLLRGDSKLNHRPIASSASRFYRYVPIEDEDSPHRNDGIFTYDGSFQAISAESMGLYLPLAFGMLRDWKYYRLDSAKLLRVEWPLHNDEILERVDECVYFDSVTNQNYLRVRRLSISLGNEVNEIAFGQFFIDPRLLIIIPKSHPCTCGRKNVFIFNNSFLNDLCYGALSSLVLLILLMLFCVSVFILLISYWQYDPLLFWVSGAFIMFPIFSYWVAGICAFGAVCCYDRYHDSSDLNEESQMIEMMHVQKQQHLQQHVPLSPSNVSYQAPDVADAKNAHQLHQKSSKNSQKSNKSHHNQKNANKNKHNNNNDANNPNGSQSHSNANAPDKQAKSVHFGAADASQQQQQQQPEQGQQGPEQLSAQSTERGKIQSMETMEPRVNDSELREIAVMYSQEPGFEAQRAKIARERKIRQKQLEQSKKLHQENEQLLDRQKFRMQKQAELSRINPLDRMEAAKKQKTSFGSESHGPQDKIYIGPKETPSFGSKSKGKMNDNEAYKLDNLPYDREVSVLSMSQNTFHKIKPKPKEKSEQEGGGNNCHRCCYLYCIKSCLVCPLFSMVLLLCPSFHAFPTDLTTSVFLITQFLMLAPQLLIDAYFLFSKYGTHNGTISSSSSSSSSSNFALSFVITDDDTLFWNLHFVYILLLALALAVLPTLSLMAYIREKMFVRWTTHFHNSDKFAIVKILLVTFVPLMLLELFPLCLLFSENMLYNHISNSLLQNLLLAFVGLKIVLFYTGNVHLVLLLILGDSAMDQYEERSNVPYDGKNGKGGKSMHLDENDKEYGCCSHLWIRLFAMVFAVLLCVIPFVPWLVYIVYQQVSQLRVKEYAKKLVSDTRVRKKSRQRKKSKIRKNTWQAKKRIKKRSGAGAGGGNAVLRVAQMMDSDDDSEDDEVYQKGDVVVLRVGHSKDRNELQRVATSSEDAALFGMRSGGSGGRAGSLGTGNSGFSCFGCCCDVARYCSLCFCGRPNSNPTEEHHICACGWKTSYMILWIYLWITWVGSMIAIQWFNKGIIDVSEDDVVVNESVYKEMGVISQVLCLLWLVVLLWVSTMFSYFSWRLALIFHCL